MKCEKYRKRISERVDGTLNAHGMERLERHLGECADCLQFEKDLKRIAAEAADLGALVPPDGVWREIQSKLEEAGRGRLHAIATRTPGFGVFARKPRLRQALAGFAALGLAAVIAGGLYRGFRPREGTRFTDLKTQERYALAKLDEAERYYQMAIRSLSEAFSAKKGSLAPQLAEMFQKNLEVIDATIEACRQGVLTEPDNFQARAYLLAAYKDKVSFLDDALEFDFQGGPAEGAPGKL